MCDGNVDCAAGEDEFGCHLKCPKGCDCVNSLSYYCMNASYRYFPAIQMQFSVTLVVEQDQWTSCCMH